ncbi:MAG TPA: hypothetical protein PKA83_19875, partial [Pirellulaceae bacterium]|nr:hypothetical protein [Pirellulaceae bacterium]
MNRSGTKMNFPKKLPSFRLSICCTRVRAVLAGCVLIFSWQPAFAVLKHWDTGQGQWGNPANWSPMGVPQIGDDVFVGNLLGIADETVFMNQDVSVNQLTIMSGMGLQSSIHCCEAVVGHRLTVQGDTTIASGGRLVMWDSVVGVDFETETLNVIGPNSRAILDDSSARVHDSVHLINGGELRLNGGGTVFLPGNGTTLVNDGLIAKNAGIRTIAQTNGGLFDLDGVFNNGRIIVGSTISPAILTLLGGGLTDSFSGEIQLGPHSQLQMQIDPWVADENSTIWAFDSGLNTVQRLSTSQVTLGGEVRTFFEAHFQILAQTILVPTVDVVVSSNSTIEFLPAWFQSIEVQGGTYQVQAGGRLEFNGATSVLGGQFQTSPNGVVLFNNDTTWNGNVNIVGIARQIGDASVSGPTTINAHLLDMDGEGDTTWSISGNAVINAGSIDTDAGNTFTGTINV